LGWAGLIVSASFGPRFRGPISAHPTERPPMSVKVTGFILIGLLPLQSSFSPLPACLPSRTQAFPTGGFIPRGSLAPTHFEAALGISSVQGFVPSAQRLPTRRRPLPPRRLSTATHPVSQVAMTPDSTSRSFSTRRCCVPLRCYPRGSSLPSSGFSPPLGPGSPPRCLGRLAVGSFHS
jgi:hypothetical protein